MDILQSVSGKLRLLAIIGDPIAQVGAPLMVNAALRDRRIGNTLMVPFHVTSQDLPTFIGSLRALQNFYGAIVTMPHKKSILPLLDNATEQAQAIGACNVIHRDASGRLSGNMLDGIGFVASLQKRGCQISGKRVYLAGAGGAATAIAHAIAGSGASELTIYNRTTDKAEALCQTLMARHPSLLAQPGTATATGQDIAINATSVGMGDDDALPFSLGGLAPSTWVCDIVIYPEKTPLLVAAESAGLPTHAGRAMLHEQIDLMLDFMLPG